MTEMRVGHGYDIHRREADRPLMLGGVRVAETGGLAGHSDADVLLHAVADGLLGAAGLGDIGEHFPDTDPRFKDADSRKLTEHLMKIVTDRGFQVVNIDVTVIAESPRLTPVKERIRRSLAELLGVGPERVNVKAKTKEGLGAVGEGRAIEAHAAVLLERENDA